MVMKLDVGKNVAGSTARMLMRYMFAVANLLVSSS